MRVLMFTQKVDVKDDLLGIYHEWIRQLAHKVDSLDVVALSVRDHELPSNVSIHSLGKEKGAGRMGYIMNFYRALRDLHGDYDTVFVHMNKEYVLLGWPIWKLFGKKIVFWYNHPDADWKSRLAFLLSDVLLHTSPYASSARFSKSVRMPVGIRVPEGFTSTPRNPVPRIVSVGRISKVKNLDLVLGVASELESRGVSFTLDFYGAPSDRADDRDYFAALKRRAPAIHRHIEFHEALPNTEVGDIFASADVSINLTKTGSLDKTIFESMAVGCPPVTQNPAVGEMLQEDVRSVLLTKEGDVADTADRLEAIFNLSDEAKNSLREKLYSFVKTEHDLPVLIERLVVQLTP